jgi:hypothetical protein
MYTSAQTFMYLTIFLMIPFIIAHIFWWTRIVRASPSSDSLFLLDCLHIRYFVSFLFEFLSGNMASFLPNSGVGQFALWIVLHSINALPQHGARECDMVSSHISLACFELGLRLC